MTLLGTGTCDITDAGGGEGGKEELTLLGTGTCDITDAGGGREGGVDITGNRYM